jgi:hypothetical protein
MAISNLTAIIIGAGGDDIVCDGAGPDYHSGKWSGLISLWQDKTPHIDPLVSTNPIYSTKEEAVKAMQDLVTQIQKERHP